MLAERHGRYLPRIPVLIPCHILYPGVQNLLYSIGMS